MGTFGLVDMGNIILQGDGICRTVPGTQSTADTAGLADLLHLYTLVP